MNESAGGAGNDPIRLRFLNNSSRLLLRTIYEWCFVGRTYVMPDGFRFLETTARVPWEFLVAELHGKLNGLETTIRLLWWRSNISVNGAMV